MIVDTYHESNIILKQVCIFKYHDNNMNNDYLNNNEGKILFQKDFIESV